MERHKRRKHESGGSVIHCFTSKLTVDKEEEML